MPPVVSCADWFSSLACNPSYTMSYPHALVEQYPIPCPHPSRHARRQAKQRGAKMYWSNRICHKAGHHYVISDCGITLRYTSNSACFKCVEARNLLRDRHLRVQSAKRTNSIAEAADPVLYQQYPQRPKTARAKGLLFYFTGKPCPKGHIALRYSNNGTCTACLGRASPPPPSE